MAFSKQFPKTIEGSNYPKWIEIYLDEMEERQVEKKARDENVKLMVECVEDAKKIISEKGLNNYQSDMVKIAISLFEKRASHSVHYKESKAKEKFDIAHNK